MNSTALKQFSLVAFVIAAAPIVPAFAWFPQGHSIIARSAAHVVPADLPTWFRDGGAQIAHDAQDPDIQKGGGFALLREVEAPRHYLDFELLNGNALPTTRADFYSLCEKLGHKSIEVGELPYALREWSERLAMDFAEARKYPNNPYIRAKTLVTAGILSHYTGDCEMPLHVTLDHDGRTLPNGKSPHSGIHAKVDSLIERVAPTPTELETDQKIVPIADLWAAINAEVLSSRSHIDETYALAPELPPATGKWTPSPKVRAFTLERARAGVNWTARLYAWAWQKSASVELPEWLRREEDLGAGTAKP